MLVRGVFYPMLVGKFCSTPSAPSSLVPLLEGTMRFALLN